MNQDKKEEIIEEVKNDWKMFEDHDPEYAVIDYDHKKVGDLLELIDKVYEAGRKHERQRIPDELEEMRKILGCEYCEPDQLCIDCNMGGIYNDALDDVEELLN